MAMNPIFGAFLDVYSQTYDKDPFMKMSPLVSNNPQSEQQDFFGVNQQLTDRSVEIGDYRGERGFEDLGVRTGFDSVGFENEMNISKDIRQSMKRIQSYTNAYNKEMTDKRKRYDRLNNMIFEASEKDDFGAMEDFWGEYGDEYNQLRSMFEDDF